MSKFYESSHCVKVVLKLFVFVLVIFASFLRLFCVCYIIECNIRSLLTYLLYMLTFCSHALHAGFGLRMELKFE